MEKLKKSAQLIDEYGHVIAEYEYEVEEKAYSVNGVAYSVYSWDLDGNPLERGFFASAYVKWDACSHFNFSGEDYRRDEEGLEVEKDSYYHICGIYNYIEHMQTMQFILEVLVEEYYSDFQYPEELKKIRSFNLLENCKIVYKLRQ